MEVIPSWSSISSQLMLIISIVTRDRLQQLLSLLSPRGLHIHFSGFRMSRSYILYFCLIMCYAIIITHSYDFLSLYLHACCALIITVTLPPALAPLLPPAVPPSVNKMEMRRGVTANVTLLTPGFIKKK